MNALKWTFPINPDNNRDKSGEDSALKIFREHTNRCLVREFAQNAIDAKSKTDESKIVEVHFSYCQLSSEESFSLLSSLREHVEACKFEESRNSNAKNTYVTKLEFIENHLHTPLNCIKISDYNTTGMMYKDEKRAKTREEYYSQKLPPFNVCVRKNGASDKSDAKAGGNHGLGKNVGLEKSPIKAVYFMSMTEPTIEEDGSVSSSMTFGEGVVSLCDHVIFAGDDVTHYMSDGFFDSHDGYMPDSGCEIPVYFNHRDEPGTDVYILGVDPSENEQNEMIQYMLRSFFPALYMEKVIFNMFGEEFNKENLVKKFDKYFPIKKYRKLDKEYDSVKRNYRYDFNPRPYCLEVLIKPKDEDHIVIDIDPVKYPLLQKGSLHIWKDESIKMQSPDTILCMREKGMVIEVRRNYNRGIGFYGVFISDGDGSERLRLMETVTHDAWDKSQLNGVKPEEKEAAIKTYEQIDTFINDQLNELFPRVEGEEKSLPGLDEILESGSSKQRKNGTNSTGMTNADDFDLLSMTTSGGEIEIKGFEDTKIGEISVRENGGINKKVKNKLTGRKTNTKTSTHGGSGNGGGQDNQDGKDKKKKQSGNADQSGSNMLPGEVDLNKKGKHRTEIVVRFLQKAIPINNGVKHRIRIEAFEDYDYCSMSINAADSDSNDGTPLNIIKVERVLNEEAEAINEKIAIGGVEATNTITGFSLHEGFNSFDVCFDDNTVHSLVIKAYEN